MKRPAFQFYPADWRKDVELRSCSVAARGLWMDILCIAHECEPYGHLVVNGHGMTVAQIAGQVGLPVSQCGRLLDELLRNGVARKTESGVIYNKRMVDDERIRNIRADAGRLGGNPNLVGDKVKQMVNLPDNQEPTPSSSSSSSSSEQVPEANASGSPDGAPPDCPHEAIIEAYHALLPTCPRVVDWTDTRRGYLRSRWREKAKPNGVSSGYTSVDDGLAWWRKFLAYCGDSKFLTGGADGRDGKSPFVADLEWIIKPSNFVKILEGKYHR